MDHSYQARRTANQGEGGETEMVLMYHHLLEKGYMDSANVKALEEKKAVLRCVIMLTWRPILWNMSYYFIKFQNYTKLTKTLEEQGEILHLIYVKLHKYSPLFPFIHTEGGTCIIEALYFIFLSCLSIKGIYLHNPIVRWDDIIGLEAAKRLVKEAVFYPIKELGLTFLFSDLPPPPPPPMLAKAVATECNTTFFIISTSSIVRKWRGVSEKLVLFELARYHAPSTIFLDELESVMSQRGVGQGRAMISHWLPPVSNTGGVELNYDSLAQHNTWTVITATNKYFYRTTTYSFINYMLFCY
uniref:Katanin p60 subunit A-like 2 n=1 Tax=Cyprinus carpio TaxID=7962 RepID=A0A8C1Y0X1_CYPCA